MSDRLNRRWLKSWNTACFFSPGEKIEMRGETLSDRPVSVFTPHLIKDVIPDSDPEPRKVIDPF
ncbi:MAG: hypothetical protein ACYC0V_05480 [Armatimonadota bacterium]